MSYNYNNITTCNLLLEYQTIIVLLTINSNF